METIFVIAKTVVNPKNHYQGLVCLASESVGYKIRADPKTADLYLDKICKMEETQSRYFQAMCFHTHFVS